jgi:hypothetical protein
VPISNVTTCGIANSEPKIEGPSLDNVETFINPHYTGEVPWTSFRSRLDRLLAANDSPLAPHSPFYYMDHRLHRISSYAYKLPREIDAYRLVRVVLRFM